MNVQIQNGNRFELWIINEYESDLCGIEYYLTAYHGA